MLVRAVLQSTLLDPLTAPDVPSLPTYLPTMSLFYPKLPYLSTYPKMGRHYGRSLSLGYDFLFKSILGQCERFKIYLSTLCVCSSLSYFIHRYSSVNLLIIGNGRSKSVVSRVIVQGVRSLGGHFARGLIFMK